ASDRLDPPTAPKPATPKPDTQHEAVQETGIDWAKLGGTVVEENAVPQDKPRETNEPRTEPDNRPPAEDTARTERDAPANVPIEPAQPAARPEPETRPQPTEPAFTRHDSTIFDFDRLRTNTRGPDENNDQTDEEKE
ncbi:MAG: hypothetical protein HON62_06670, partial [Rhodospirillaceae bacterium]|nr:hypothetical protein [Rhodospirillaceae bacterium]